MPRILPNISSLRYQTVQNQFLTAQKFSASGNIYGIESTKTDAHMMKNSEWAVAAYLSQSIYGKYGNKDYSGANKEIYKNDSSSYYTGRSYGQLSTATGQYSSTGVYKYDGTSTSTGVTNCLLCGTGASTTGNIYGIYDMSGGTYEYVMGNYNNTTINSDFASSWFTTTGNSKYYDKFTTEIPSTTKSSETIGQAYVETAGWYSDSKGTLKSSYPWVIRGDLYSGSTGAGAFKSGYIHGGAHYAYSFRSVLVDVDS